ncbi:hypothetical protein F66182_887 [Fusarium sp. NRRL 66182]|nr:hypothetical protein F66182_887 [Fusarium sp. NRRL 66182]
MMNKLIVALALASASSAVPLSRRADCQDAYNACVAAGTFEVACACAWAACAGEDNARNREYCATATASVAEPTKTEIPGGCNPAHPGSCHDSDLDNPAKETPPPTLAPPTPVPTGGSGSGSGSDDTTYPSPKPVDGKTWTIKDLIRYCGEGNDGCDYNFQIEADGKTERCTVIRMPGSDAATESWSNEPCTDGSEFTVSWGYVTEPAPAFAVVTVNKGEELAWFGVSDVNGQKVSPSSPFGSGHFGNLGPE